MWRIRGNLPHVIESTAVIVDVMLSDEAGPQHSRFNLQAAYASAFCRFVTGMCDSVQTGRRKKSMFQAAEEIGLPEYFVELRHEATHEELPNVSELRRVSDEALSWLWDYYWRDLA
jgi:ribosomal biogenesis protein LAS1